MSAYAEVIGDPIDHSKSPQIHRFWLEQLGIDADYRATRVTRAGIAEFIAARRRDKDWRGCNVTMPLKLDALLLADQPTDRAAATGACNLLAPREGKLLAGNTDVGAIMMLVASIYETGAPPGVVLLGNGGAARAVLVALRTLGIGPVRLQARDMKAALSLAVEFGLPEGPSPFDRALDLGGLINATPMGMSGYPPIPLGLAGMPKGGWVFDLVTDPVRTALISEADARGFRTIDGIAMLVEQAAASFELFFGQAPPRDRDAELMELLR
jgi:shikimate dehydrogenase